jgi:hypothetical protein
MYLAALEDQQREVLSEEMQRAAVNDQGVFPIQLEPFDRSAKHIPILEAAVTWGFSWLFRDVALPVCWTHIVPMLPSTEPGGAPEARSALWTAPERRERHDSRIDGEPEPLV